MFIDYLKAIIFGVVQGATEFLPVSSSGHLVILHEYLVFPIQNELIFDVLLHLATLIAVIVFFWPDVKRLISSWVKSLFGRKDEYSRLSWYIVGATFPAAVIGVLFGDYIENNFRSIPVVSFMLVAVALLFILAEKITIKEKELTQMNFKNVLLVGFAQALALIPGTSRSGITIIAGLFMKLKREEAIRLSFLLSIPIITGASLVNLGELLNLNIDKDELLLLSVSFLSAFFSAFLAIKYFLKIAARFGLNVFAYYRILLAVVLMIFWVFTK